MFDLNFQLTEKENYQNHKQIPFCLCYCLYVSVDSPPRTKQLPYKYPEEEDGKKYSPPPPKKSENT